MNLLQLLDELEYSSAPSYVRLADARTYRYQEAFRLYQAIQTALPNSIIDGVYLFNTSPKESVVLPDKSAVVVAEAKSVPDAQALHRKLWNTGNAP